MSSVIKSMFETIKSKEGKIPFCILWAYIFLISLFHCLESTQHYPILFIIILVVFSYVVASLLYFLFDKFYIEERKLHKNNSISNKKLAIKSILVCAITFVFFFMYYGAFYPGGMVVDSIMQYEQAKFGVYDSWMPVLQTLIFFTIPIRLGLSLGGIILLQIIYFCLGFTYLYSVLLRNNCPDLIRWIALGYVWINPYIGTYLMHPIKDTALMIFAVILIGQYIQIVLSKGKWLESKINILAFAAILVAASNMRHNAILLTAPLGIIVLLIVVKNNKTRILITAGTVLVYVLLRIFLSLIPINYSETNIVETIGLPINVWCNVMKDNPGALSEETRELMYTFATQEAYGEIYKQGNFNNIKFSGNINLDNMSALNYSDVAKITWECFKRAPRESFAGAFKCTGVVWDVKETGTIAPIEIYENEWVPSDNEPLFYDRGFAQGMIDFFGQGISNILLGTIGFMMLMMIAFGLYQLSKKKYSIIYILPVLCYNFGTMLLLSTYGDYRFFLWTVPVWIPVMFLMDGESKTN